MLAVRASPAATSQRFKTQRYEVACVNVPEDTVLSGAAGDVSRARGISRQQGIDWKQLEPRWLASRMLPLGPGRLHPRRVLSCLRGRRIPQAQRACPVSASTDSRPP